MARRIFVAVDPKEEGGLLDPVWRKAPLVLLGTPGVLLGLLATAVVLGLAAASGPLFLSSGERAAFTRELAELDPEHAGLTVNISVRHDADAIAAVDRALRDEAGDIPALAEPVQRLVGGIVRVGDEEISMRPLAATGAIAALTPVGTAGDGGDGDDGAWVPASVAGRLGLGAGDSLDIHYGGQVVAVPITGVYADLTATSLTSYWQDLASLILPRESGSAIEPPPPPLLVMDDTTMLTTGERLGTSGAALWRFPLRTGGMDLAAAHTAHRQMRALEERVRNTDTELGAVVRDASLYWGHLRTGSPLDQALRGVEETTAALLGPVRTLGVGAQAVALLVVGAAAAFRARRRRVELRLLATRGVGPTGQAARAVLESALVVGLGLVVGWAVAGLAVTALGPAPVGLVGEAGRAALRDTALAGVLGLVAVGMVTAASVRAHERSTARLARLAGRAPWEAVAVALAAAAYYQMRLGGEAVVDGPQGGQVDVLVLLFPLLLLAGLAGTAVRLLRRALPALRGVGSSWPIAPYLAVRRLTRASSTALLLVTAAALGLGVFVYAGALAVSTQRSAETKSLLAVGAQTAVRLPRGDHAELGRPGMTVVGRGTATLQPADVLVDVLAVDTDFLEGAAWPSTPAAPAPSVLDALRDGSGEALPVLLVGVPAGSARDGTLRSPRYAFPVSFAEAVDLFPGMPSDRPMVVVDRRVFAEAFERADGIGDPARVLDVELWARVGPDAVEEVLTAAGITSMGTTTAAGMADQPSSRAVGWTLGYLRAVGGLAAIVALAAALLYLQERQQEREVTYALASRMGLSPGDHRRAIGLELAGMLGLALALGLGLSLLAAGLVIGEVDPLPALPPGPTLAFPSITAASSLLGVAAACLVGAALVQRAAERARIGEVLRVAD